jgi:hypothetical protein
LRNLSTKLQSVESLAAPQTGSAEEEWYGNDAKSLSSTLSLILSTPKGHRKVYVNLQKLVLFQ